MEGFKISSAGEFVGKEVILKGWVYQKRSSGKIQFYIFRDGTGLIQGVVEQRVVPPEVFALYDTLTLESSVIVKGVVREDKRAPSGYELLVNDIKPVSISEEYPITPKPHGIEFLLKRRHLWIRSRRQQAILRVRDELIYAIREFFKNKGFVLIDTPILTGSIGETASTLFETDYFGKKAYLSQTGQLYLEAAIFSFGNVYCFGPTFRAERSKTRRHLIEFWMVEAEEAFYDNDMNIALQEEFVEYIVQAVLDRAADYLKDLGRNTKQLERVVRPFPKISYDEAIKYLQSKGSQIKWGDDLGGDEETIISKSNPKPTFVMNYPKKAKAFYMKENPANPETVLCADLIAPEGYGEIIGGSQREDDINKLLARIREEGLPEKAYEWYIDLRRYGSVPHSGFGLGVERTLAWICKLPHVREAIPFPRLYKKIYP